MFIKISTAWSMLSALAQASAALAICIASFSFGVNLNKADLHGFVDGRLAASSAPMPAEVEPNCGSSCGEDSAFTITM